MLLKKWVSISLILSISVLLIFATDNIINAQRNKPDTTQKKLAGIEKAFNRKVGLYALNTDNGEIISYRAQERFPIQSTFKLIEVAAILKASTENPELLQKNLMYNKTDLVFGSPITKKNIGSGMKILDLAAATISYSDNTAANLLMKELGGPKHVTDFAKTIGNTSFNIRNWEPTLNSNPNRPEDTSTPLDMAKSLNQILLGNILTKAQCNMLLHWMKLNTTGNARIRAGVPQDWIVADKTGSGHYGIANDIALMWPPGCKPIIIAIYTVQNSVDTKPRNEIIAAVTKVVVKNITNNQAPQV